MEVWKQHHPWATYLSYPHITRIYIMYSFSDGCVAENTTNPSPDNDTSLDFILQWPETDIGQTSVLR